MSFLDKIMETAAKAASAASVAANKAAVAGKAAANTAVQQTKTAAAIGKVKLAIVSEEDKLKKAYTELGRIFYRDYEAQTEADMEEYQPWCDCASEAKAQIVALNAQMEALKEDAAKKDAPVVDTLDAIEEDEDPSIYADFVEAQPAEVVLAYEEEPAVPETADAAEMTEAAEPAEETAVDTPAEAERPEASEMPDVPTVGTLYVDITGQE